MTRDTNRRTTLATLRSIVILVAGMGMGALLVIGLGAPASVTIPPPASEPHTTVQAMTACVDYMDGGATNEMQVRIMVVGERANGTRIPNTATHIDIRIPPTSGAPVFRVQGYAVDRGIVPSCSATRTAALATLNAWRADVEAFSANCLN